MNAIRAIVAAIAFLGSMWAGVYLCIHDFQVLGGWVCILSLLGGWGFEKSFKA